MGRVANNKTTVFIGVGSNIEPEENISAVLKMLIKQVRVVAVSPFYRSQAVGTLPQSDFINGIFKIQTDLAVRELKFSVLRKIEQALGRVRTSDKNAARTIDLDIVLYGGLVLEEPGLVIPDPGLAKYPFVAIPLLDLSPEIVVPGAGKLLKKYFPGDAESYQLEKETAFTQKLLRMIKQIR